ncbi:hypothetical protein JCM11641_006669 [Rhodosporidiobolus odoratus]
MARAGKRSAPAAAVPTSKKQRTQAIPSTASGDSNSSLDHSNFDGEDGLDGLDRLDEELESEDEFAGGAGAGEDGSTDAEEEERDEDEEDEDSAGGDADDDMIGDDDGDLHAALEAGSDAETSGDEGGVVDDGWETVGTAPSEPRIAPAAELDKTRKVKRPKPLSAAELRALAFAELTASPVSNVLSTLVAPLLNPLTPPAPASSPLQPVLKTLHSHITSLPKQKPISLVQLKKQGRIVPEVVGGEGKWVKMELPWEKPRGEDVRIVGKWAWGGAVKEKGEYAVDLAVAMPPTLLQPKDFLAPRFSVKSLHYLVTLAALLPQSLGPTSSSFLPLPGSRGYALEIRSATPRGAEKVGLGKVKGAVLRIQIVSPPGAFSHAKLSPTSNAARPPSHAASADEQPQFDPTSLPFTPLRTTSLHLSSLPLLTSHLKYHHSLSTAYSSYAASTRLLQTWAIRRGYGASLGLSNDWWAWCVARSLNAGKAMGGDVASLAAGGEAWAGWRKAMEWLASANWTEGIWFKSTAEDTYDKDDFQQAFKGKALFVDPTSTVNLAAGIELSTLELLKHDARETVSLLLAAIEDERKFDSAFVREVRAVERFDNFARITVPRTPKVDGDASIDHADPLTHFVSSVTATLRRALGNRVRAFILTPPPPSASPASSTPTLQYVSAITLTLGILLDPSQSLRLVDQGPSAEDEEACADFRAFWGRKSELRRFKDGAIVESVVWDQPGSGGLGPQRGKIVHHIVKYILDERHGIPANNVEFFAAPMDHLLVEPEPVRRAIYLEDSVATGKGFGNVIAAFDAISKEIKDLPDLPLTVASVQPCSPSLRYSTVFTPSPRRLKNFERQPDASKYLAAHDIILTLESSGRWPDDLEGIQKIKSAFLSKIANGLEATRAVLRAQVAFDREARPVDDNVYLEILTASGWAFRARIFYERSQLLLEEREEQLAEAPSSTSSSANWNRRFVHAPKHHSAFSNLQHHFTSYSQTVRLFKRWVSAHMLSPHVSDESLELLVASVFLDAATPYDPPNSGATGFARVMDRITRWDWRDEPLLVPIYSFSNAVTSGRRPVLPTADKTAAVSAFQAMRLAKPAMDEHAWVIATEDDLEGTRWTQATGKVAAARIRGLAKATLKTLETGVTAGGLVVEQLFSPPLADYAFLIHLEPTANPRHFQAISPDSRSLDPLSRSSIVSGSLMGQAAEDDAIRIGWDPVMEFCRQLQRLYPTLFLLFYSAEGSSTIGGIWKPSFEGAKAFKVGSEGPQVPVADAAEGMTRVVLDKRAVLREIQRLAAGLVVTVEESR